MTEARVFQRMVLSLFVVEMFHIYGYYVSCNSGLKQIKIVLRLDSEWKNVLILQ